MFHEISSFLRRFVLLLRLDNVIILLPDNGNGNIIVDSTLQADKFLCINPQGQAAAAELTTMMVRIHDLR